MWESQSKIPVEWACMSEGTRETVLEIMLKLFLK